MYILIIALILFSISALAHWRVKKLGKEGFWLYTLKRMPALCAVIGLIFVANLILRFYLPSVFDSKLIESILIAFFVILNPIVLIFIAYGIVLNRGLKSGKNARFLTKSFFAGFFFSLFVTVATMVPILVYEYNSWQGVNLPDGVRLETNRSFHMTSEFERRIEFKSGKIVEIEIDPCGMSEFEVYRLADKKIYLRCVEGDSAHPWGFSFLIDPKNETAETNDNVRLTDAEFLGKLEYLDFSPAKK